MHFSFQLSLFNTFKQETGKPLGIKERKGYKLAWNAFIFKDWDKPQVLDKLVLFDQQA